MTEGSVHVQIPKPGVVELILNRPAKRNALNLTLLNSLNDSLASVVGRPETRVLILSGQPPVFCAGMDLDEASDPKIGRN
jgi:enoyl-CoA hydratase/carnithine racemase